MSAQPADVGSYTWAASCKDCHAKEYASWEQTKHAKTILRLSADERGAACFKCHSTMGDAALANDVNVNVQCERCHGAGKAHIDAAASGAKKPGHIVAVPEESVCVECHSEQSPHFNFFSYLALKPLVHQTK
ncbi:MAG TPA: multiheme c-type cytochrome [Vicinamibacterales bacterium]|nr:multiheme c-type cytochrome [Vicinamibacterales bacterium]